MTGRIGSLQKNPVLKYQHMPKQIHFGSSQDGQFVVYTSSSKMTKLFEVKASLWICTALLQQLPLPTTAETSNLCVVAAIH